MKLNLGCGSDIREGWVNIDDMARPGILTWNLSLGLPPMEVGKLADEILAKDILEHLHHWEGARLLRECYRILIPGGILTVQVPDVVSVVKSEMPWEQKLTWLYGGQDQPQGKDAEMERSRKDCPSRFCHRWGFTSATLEKAVAAAGFTCRVEHSGLNLICHATKPSAVDAVPAQA